MKKKKKKQSQHFVIPFFDILIFYSYSRSRVVLVRICHLQKSITLLYNKYMTFENNNKTFFLLLIISKLQ